MKTINKKKQVHIMDSIDILDRVDVLVFQSTPGYFDVDFACKEKNKRLVLDEKAKETLADKLTQLCQGKNASDANTVGYIQEYTGRLLQQYHKCNLALIEDIPEAIDDHYKTFRNT